MKFILFILFVFAASSCNLENADQNEMQPGPSDAPLADFIIGEWESEVADNYKGEASNYKYEVEFVDAGTVKFVELSADGRLLDGITSPYDFLDANTISIDNPRIEGGERWALERNEQTLIVARTIGNETDRIVFVRMVNK